MAVGSPPPIDIPPVPGFRLAATACGLKATGRPDLLLVHMHPGTAVAGVFTRNQVVAAPVQICRQRLVGGRADALIVNAGNANAGTGPQGVQNALEVSRSVARELSVPEACIFISSTGVIGQPLPVEKIRAAIPSLAANLRDDAWSDAAVAITTTDTFPKARHRRCTLDGRPVLLAGIAKGAGMIHPDMATLLAYVFTDAAITPMAWQRLLERAVSASFNSITVDGDTSTNDTLLGFASGLAGNDLLTDPDSPRAAPLVTALNDLCQELAHLIVRDGEGATKFITITVAGAKSEADARQIGKVVAHSQLVKTAFFGQDPNWGRILAAVGRAGIPINVDAVDIHLGDVQIVQKGGLDPTYTEARGAQVMSAPEIAVHIHLHAGSAAATTWTCDLSHDYVTINADYRT
ncbi:MAG: bifunctional glutamate N-acetyltransferase/amino-acid acetyltransferase ArgJ [Magnetococcales bacterium]|nr:bifunctional glutamate N-acetyltransferase/amino-acid acetyltransferase ArgJ [Magnetococcales bacterium]MBF0323023.1 bifunctional glutamate N-acetyltransferase/amino-acid acetyltransferase ArgJ [Magnetococcales bacterium]